MKGWTYGAIAAVSGIFAAGLIVATPHVSADQMNKLVIDGEEITTRVAAPEGHPLGNELISGWEFRARETQALEMDDFENPAFLAVETGEGLWNEVDGSEGKSCASCHGEASDSMAGVRAAMPKWDASAGKPMTLEQHINRCRTDRMGADEWKWESGQMLGMTAYVGLQSRGMPVQPDDSGDMASWRDRGKELYYTRVGQLDMACATCHEAYFGQYIRADRLSQGHSNGFPTYRLKWQKVGSLHRRFSGCMKQVRAKPYKRGSDEFVALEAYLASRGAGLDVETPAVRQ